MSDLINMDVCDVIQDIIPLYHDNVCSNKSRQYVENHIKSCKKCEDLLKSLDAEDSYEKNIKNETQMVLAHHAKQEKTLAMKAGMVIAALLLLPIIIVLLVTLSGGASFRTDIVLIASMLLVAGLTVVPLMSKKNKFSKMMIFSTLSLLLVIFTSHQLFYHGSILEFFEIAFSVVFGLSIPFFPFVIRQASLPEGLQNKKGLITMIWDTVWFYLMMISFGIVYPEAWHDLICIGTFGISLPWVIFVIARYIGRNCLIKAGGILLGIDAWLWIGSTTGWVTIEVGNHPGLATIIIYATFASLGVLFSLVGLFKRK